MANHEENNLSNSKFKEILEDFKKTPNFIKKVVGEEELMEKENTIWDSKIKEKIKEIKKTPVPLKEPLGKTDENQLYRSFKKKLENQKTSENLKNDDQAQTKVTNKNPQKVESEAAKNKNFDYSQEKNQATKNPQDFKVEIGPKKEAETSYQTKEKQSVKATEIMEQGSAVEMQIPTRIKSEVRPYYLAQTSPIPTQPKKPPLATLSLAFIAITITALYVQNLIRKNEEKREDSFFIRQFLPYRGLSFDQKVVCTRPLPHLHSSLKKGMVGQVVGFVDDSVQLVVLEIFVNQKVDLGSQIEYISSFICLNETKSFSKKERIKNFFVRNINKKLLVKAGNIICQEILPKKN